MPWLGLTGRKEKETNGPLVRSVSAAMNAIATHDACGAAGDHGAITVWKDDNDDYHADFQRHYSTLAHGIFQTKTDLREFLKEHWPKIESAMTGFGSRLGGVA